MNVSEIMTSDVDVVSNENTLQEAAAKMKDLDIGELPIVVGDEAVGMITDRDIAIRGVAHGLDPKAAKVVDAMSEGVIYCKADDDIQKAAGIMSRRKIRRLPVMDDAGKMVGVVSLGGLAMKLEPSSVGDVLRAISK
jgi:CBS domain-containing protein